MTMRFHNWRNRRSSSSKRALALLALAILAVAGVWWFLARSLGPRRAAWGPAPTPTVTPEGLATRALEQEPSGESPRHPPTPPNPWFDEARRIPWLVGDASGLNPQARVLLRAFYERVRQDPWIRENVLNRPLRCLTDVLWQEAGGPGDFPLVKVSAQDLNVPGFPLFQEPRAGRGFQSPVGLMLSEVTLSPTMVEVLEQEGIARVWYQDAGTNSYVPWYSFCEGLVQTVFGDPDRDDHAMIAWLAAVFAEVMRTPPEARRYYRYTCLPEFASGLMAPIDAYRYGPDTLLPACYPNPHLGLTGRHLQADAQALPSDTAWALNQVGATNLFPADLLVYDPPEYLLGGQPPRDLGAPFRGFASRAFLILNPWDEYPKGDLGTYEVWTRVEGETTETVWTPPRDMVLSQDAYRDLCRTAACASSSWPDDSWVFYRTGGLLDPYGRDAARALEERKSEPYRRGREALQALTSWLQETLGENHPLLDGMKAWGLVPEETGDETPIVRREVVYAPAVFFYWTPQGRVGARDAFVTGAYNIAWYGVDFLESRLPAYETGWYAKFANMKDGNTLAAMRYTALLAANVHPQGTSWYVYHGLNPVTNPKYWSARYGYLVSPKYRADLVWPEVYVDDSGGVYDREVPGARPLEAYMRASDVLLEDRLRTLTRAARWFHPPYDALTESRDIEAVTSAAPGAMTYGGLALVTLPLKARPGHPLEFLPDVLPRSAEGRVPVRSLPEEQRVELTRNLLLGVRPDGYPEFPLPVETFSVAWRAYDLTLPYRMGFYYLQQLLSRQVLPAVPPPARQAIRDQNEVQARMVARLHERSISYYGLALVYGYEADFTNLDEVERKVLNPAFWPNVTAGYWDVEAIRENPDARRTHLILLPSVLPVWFAFRDPVAQLNAFSFFLRHPDLAPAPREYFTTLYATCRDANSNQVGCLPRDEEIRVGVWLNEVFGALGPGGVLYGVDERPWGDLYPYFTPRIHPALILPARPNVEDLRAAGWCAPGDQAALEQACPDARPYLLTPGTGAGLDARARWQVTLYQTYYALAGCHEDPFGLFCAWTRSLGNREHLLNALHRQALREFFGVDPLTGEPAGP